MDAAERQFCVHGFLQDSVIFEFAAGVLSSDDHWGSVTPSTPCKHSNAGDKHPVSTRHWHRVSCVRTFAQVSACKSCCCELHSGQLSVFFSHKKTKRLSASGMGLACCSDRTDSQPAMNDHRCKGESCQCRNHRQQDSRS